METVGDYFFFCFFLFPSGGLFRVRMDDSAIIEIIDSTFRGNGQFGNSYSSYGIVSGGVNTFIALDIMQSKFISNTQSRYGCFSLYQGEVTISQSLFDSNQGIESVVLLGMTGTGGNVVIEDTLFNDNSDLNPSEFGFLPGSLYPHGMFDTHSASISVNNSVFTNNWVSENGLFTTKGIITISNSTYTNNLIASIVWKSMSVTIERSRFEENTMAGIIRNDDTSTTLDIIDSKFISNTQNNNRYYCFALFKGQVHITQSLFEFNEGMNGIIYLIAGGQRNSNVVIEKSVFRTNIIDGTMILAGGANIEIIQTSFTDNSVHELAFMGAGRLISARNITVNASEFDTNAGLS